MINDNPMNFELLNSEFEFDEGHDEMKTFDDEDGDFFSPSSVDEKQKGNDDVKTLESVKKGVEKAVGEKTEINVKPPEHANIEKKEETEMERVKRKIDEEIAQKQKRLVTEKKNDDLTKPVVTNKILDPFEFYKNKYANKPKITNTELTADSIAKVAGTRKADEIEVIKVNKKNGVSKTYVLTQQEKIKMDSKYALQDPSVKLLRLERINESSDEAQSRLVKMATETAFYIIVNKSQPSAMDIQTLYNKMVDEVPNELVAKNDALINEIELEIVERRNNHRAFISNHELPDYFATQYTSKNTGEVGTFYDTLLRCYRQKEVYERTIQQKATFGHLLTRRMAIVFGTEEAMSLKRNGQQISMPVLATSQDEMMRVFRWNKRSQMSVSDAGLEWRAKNGDGYMYQPIIMMDVAVDYYIDNTKTAIKMRPHDQVLFSRTFLFDSKAQYGKLLQLANNHRSSTGHYSDAIQRIYNLATAALETTRSINTTNNFWKSKITMDQAITDVRVHFFGDPVIGSISNFYTDMTNRNGYNKDIRKIKRLPFSPDQFLSTTISQYNADLQATSTTLIYSVNSNSKGTPTSNKKRNETWPSEVINAVNWKDCYDDEYKEGNTWQTHMSNVLAAAEENEMIIVDDMTEERKTIAYQHNDRVSRLKWMLSSLFGTSGNCVVKAKDETIKSNKIARLFFPTYATSHVYLQFVTNWYMNQRSKIGKGNSRALSGLSPDDGTMSNLFSLFQDTVLLSDNDFRLYHASDNMYGLQIVEGKTVYFSLDLASCEATHTSHSMLIPTFHIIDLCCDNDKDRNFLKFMAYMHYSATMHKHMHLANKSGSTSTRRVDLLTSFYLPIMPSGISATYFLNDHLSATFTEACILGGIKPLIKNLEGHYEFSPIFIQAYEGFGIKVTLELARVVEAVDHGKLVMFDFLGHDAVCLHLPDKKVVYVPVLNNDRVEKALVFNKSPCEPDAKGYCNIANQCLTLSRFNSLYNSGAYFGSYGKLLFKSIIYLAMTTKSAIAELTEESMVTFKKYLDHQGYSTEDMVSSVSNSLPTSVLVLTRKKTANPNVQKSTLIGVIEEGLIDGWETEYTLFDDIPELALLVNQKKAIAKMNDQLSKVDYRTYGKFMDQNPIRNLKPQENCFTRLEECITFNNLTKRDQYTIRKNDNFSIRATMLDLKNTFFYRAKLYANTLDEGKSNTGYYLKNDKGFLRFIAYIKNWMDYMVGVGFIKGPEAFNPNKFFPTKKMNTHTYDLSKVYSKVYQNFTIIFKKHMEKGGLVAKQHGIDLEGFIATILAVEFDQNVHGDQMLNTNISVKTPASYYFTDMLPQNALDLGKTFVMLLEYLVSGRVSASDNSNLVPMMSVFGKSAVAGIVKTYKYPKCWVALRAYEDHVNDKEISGKGFKFFSKCFWQFLSIGDYAEIDVFIYNDRDIDQNVKKRKYFFEVSEFYSKIPSEILKTFPSMAQPLFNSIKASKVEDEEDIMTMVQNILTICDVDSTPVSINMDGYEALVSELYTSYADVSITASSVLRAILNRMVTSRMTNATSLLLYTKCLSIGRNGDPLARILVVRAMQIATTQNANILWKWFELYTGAQAIDESDEELIILRRVSAKVAHMEKEQLILEQQKQMELIKENILINEQSEEGIQHKRVRVKKGAKGMVDITDTVKIKYGSVMKNEGGVMHGAPLQMEKLYTTVDVIYSKRPDRLILTINGGKNTINDYKVGAYHKNRLDVHIVSLKGTHKSHCLAGLFGPSYRCPSLHTKSLTTCECNHLSLLPDDNTFTIYCRYDTPMPYYIFTNELRAAINGKTIKGFNELSNINDNVEIQAQKIITAILGVVDLKNILRYEKDVNSENLLFREAIGDSSVFSLFGVGRMENPMDETTSIIVLNKVAEGDYSYATVIDTEVGELEGTWCDYHFDTSSVDYFDDVVQSDTISMSGLFNSLMLATFKKPVTTDEMIFTIPQREFPHLFFIHRAMSRGLSHMMEDHNKYLMANLGNQETTKQELLNEDRSAKWVTNSIFAHLQHNIKRSLKALLTMEPNKELNQIPSKVAYEMFIIYNMMVRGILSHKTAIADYFEHGYLDNSLPRAIAVTANDFLNARGGKPTILNYLPTLKRYVSSGEVTTIESITSYFSNLIFDSKNLKGLFELLMCNLGLTNDPRAIGREITSVGLGIPKLFDLSWGKLGFMVMLKENDTLQRMIMINKCLKYRLLEFNVLLSDYASGEAMSMMLTNNNIPALIKKCASMGITFFKPKITLKEKERIFARFGREEGKQSLYDVSNHLPERIIDYLRV